MTAIITDDIEIAARHVRDGELIAYPTESVFGLGCLPDQASAVQRLLELKGRQGWCGLDCDF